MRKILLMMAAILCAGVSYAQNIAVSGVVTDADNGEPLMGVSVAVMGTTMGAATDLDGRYSLSVPTGSSLTFSYLGYASQTIEVTGRTLNVALASDSKALDEILVVGYGTQTKSSFTGSASMVQSKTIEAHIASNPVQALAGTAAGVQFISTTGDPASSSQSIRIRGIGSMSASSQPLIVVDGSHYL